MTIFAELQWRELVYDASDGLEEHLAAGPVTCYIGFDPSAASLHVGSLLPILNLARMQRFGHNSIALVGSGTGMIGDPSGKTRERQLLTPAQVEENARAIKDQLAPFLDFEARDHPAVMAHNGDWLNTVSLIDFLREIGKHFTVNYMLAKESVQRRLETDDGISYTEFSYLLLQAWDFLVLHDRYGCTMQMGGSDQWGNITAGAELIRKLRQRKAYGLVSPLVTSATGVKFGKTEAGTVWLDGELTSPYRFYQFWLNTADADVVRYLKYFTWLPRDEIAALEAAHVAAPEKREAHRRLAREVTAMVHGETSSERAIRSSEVLFGGEVGDLGAAELLEIFDDVPSSQLAPGAFDGDGLPFVELLVGSGLVPSKGAARRLIRDGGAYLNNRRLTDERALVTRADLLDGTILLLRKGQKQHHLATLTGELSP